MEYIPSTEGGREGGEGRGKECWVRREKSWVMGEESEGGGKERFCEIRVAHFDLSCLISQYGKVVNIKSSYM